MHTFSVPPLQFRLNSEYFTRRIPPHGKLLGGAKLVSGGKFAKALFVDGSSTGQYVDFGTPSGQCLYEPDLCENGATVEVWFQYKTIPVRGNIGYILDSGSSDANTVGISFGITDTQFFIKINLRESSYEYSIPLFPSNIWQFITFVFNVGDGLSLYINGCDAKASRITTGGDYTVREVPISVSNPPSPFRIGGHDDHKAEMLIDHLHVWYEDLQPGEVWQLFVNVGRYSR